MLAAVVLAFALLSAPRALAQYKNGQFGFETGAYVPTGNSLDPWAYFGLRGGYKLSDHWWFMARAAVSFPRSQLAPNPTVVALHVVPAEVRYYFATDSVRPFAGITNSFQFYFNTNTGSDAVWGPGVSLGVEFRVRRDVFIGIEGDAFTMFVFGGSPFIVSTGTAQLLFFF
jgi:hypothetical protein